MSIKRKLLLATIVSAGVSVLLLWCMSLIKETLDWHAEQRKELNELTDVMAGYVVPSILAGDDQGVERALLAFVEDGPVEAGAIYNDKGVMISASGEFRRSPEAETIWYADDGKPAEVIISKPIMNGGERIGTIYVGAGDDDLYADMMTDGAMSLAAASFAFMIALLVHMKMRRGITGPIDYLSGVMREVMHDKNFTVRAKMKDAGEIGLLANTFDEMIDGIEARDKKLSEHREMLEQTVEKRTAEIREAHDALEKELVERKAAEQTLVIHDSMLRAVAKAAEELLGVLKVDDAINSVLELIGGALGVSQIHVAKATTNCDGHILLYADYEWCSPGVTPYLHDPVFQGLDLTANFPHAIAPNLLGEAIQNPVEGMPAPIREKLEANGLRSVLVIPIMSDKKFWGSVVFMDSSPATREWSWAETDTLKTLSNLLGASISRASVVKELADANTIVQNSPTVLYRLKGEPALPLTYVSNNIRKFGLDPAKLIGADNFLQELVHKDDREKLQAEMANILNKDATGAAVEFRLMQPSGSYRWVENRYTPVRDEAGRLIEVEGIIIDITERKNAEEKIARLARTDSLTGLANRSTFVDRLHQLFAAAKRNATPFSVLYLDLDHFKDINDTRGHPTGDKLLCEVASRLQNIVRESDIVARLGGDEFAVLQTSVAHPSDAGNLAGKICKSLGSPYIIDDDELHVSASIGISLFSQEIAEPDAMLKQADLALYRAKDEGRNQYRFHSDEIDKEVGDRVALAEELRKAISGGEIEVYYQPEVEILSGDIVGMEAMLRWNHPTRGAMLSADFMGIAEETGTIHALGQIVLEDACRQMKLWRDEGIAPPIVAVNVSLLQLKAGSQFVNKVKNALKKFELPPEFLELDVTESVLAQATLAQNDVLDRLRQLGVRIALNHFGTEYSSFDYLRAYHVNHLKLAQEFIEGAARDSKQAAMVRAIIGVARELGIQVVVDGVKTTEQRAVLVSIGAASSGQKPLLNGPVPPAKAVDLLKERNLQEEADNQEGAA